jgi:hypothetical protein
MAVDMRGLHECRINQIELPSELSMADKVVTAPSIMPSNRTISSLLKLRRPGTDYGRQYFTRASPER